MDEPKKYDGEEERSRLREAYKKEYQQRRSFLEQVEQNRHINRIQQALSDMLGWTDDTDDWLRKLDTETAENDARTELALQKYRHLADENLRDQSEGQDSAIDPLSSDLESTYKTLGDFKNQLENDPTEENVGESSSSEHRKTLGDERH